MDTDRNLLFAILALQADLIDRDRFIQACTLWAARKDTPIAELVVAQGWLTAADRADIERLLLRKLNKHGGDVRASIVEVAGAAIRSALATVADAEVQQSVAELAGSPRPTPAVNGAAAPATPDSAGRNELYEEIGRGGMGRVLRGRDTDLRRELAVKVLREEYSGDVDVERRFVEEAQIGGQLQHPGIVPVYELGRFPDRRPFFTMKLVNGQTLTDLLKDRPDVSHAQARFLVVFEQVCQTVAYAHSKGVIHRDLKPANVMVGAFGEVQVMDWGLAKVLGKPNGADPQATTARSVIQTARAGSTAENDNRTGVVGTPAFMAPEQARGDVDSVDERADVFGLGAILCVILTGQAPYPPADRNGTLQAAAGGDLTEAFSRLENSGADAELVDLARACLAPERECRPGNGQDVAERVEAYRTGVAERLRHAELERVAAEARMVEERKRRRLAIGLAAAVLALALTGGSGAWWYQRERDAQAAEFAERRANTEREVTATLSEANTLIQEGWKQTDEPDHWGATVKLALSAVQRAEGLLITGEGSKELTERVKAARGAVNGAERDFRLRTDLDRIRLEEAGIKDGSFDNTAIAPQYRKALASYGIELLDLKGAAESVQSSRIREALLAGIEDWAWATPDEAERKSLITLLRTAVPESDHFRRRWWDALRRQAAPELVSLVREPMVRDFPAATLVNMARQLRIAGERGADEWRRNGRERRINDAGIFYEDTRRNPPLSYSLLPWEVYLFLAYELLIDEETRFPGDFWVNHELGMLLQRRNPQPFPGVDAESATPFLSAAARYPGRKRGRTLQSGERLGQ